MRFMSNLFTRLRRAPALLAVALLHPAPARAAPPHVVLIMADDLGWMDLRCQGNERLNTPRLDALAQHGVRFTSAYAASPVCSPTRGALITGLAPARLRITQHGRDGPAFWPKDRRLQPPAAEHVLPLKAVTLAERLKEAGYATGFFGKWHLSGDPDPKDPLAGGPDFWPERQGFDVNVGGCGLGGPPTHFDPYRVPALKPRKQGEYLDDRLADETVAFMRAHHKQPMFVCLWPYNVHYPFEAPAELVAKYKGKEGPGLKNATYAAQVEAMDRAVEWYHQRLLHDPAARPARDYLRSRGLAGEVARTFRLGWAPDDWDALMRDLRLPADIARDTGLAFTNKSGRLQDAFRGRVMFPITDARGRIIAFGGRILDKGEPKYLNSPETPLFEKGRELYGLYQARRAIRDAGRVIVVEGRNVRTRLLSGREAARLMGLPDDYVLPRRYSESCHLLGDGVSVPVVRFLAQNLLSPLLDATAIPAAAE